MQKDSLPSDYGTFLSSVKQQVQQARLKAIVSVNEQLITLYWQIGKQILERQEKEGWGSGVIEQLAHDLTDTFPDMRGLSARNLGYMKSFAEAYPDESILQRVAKLPWRHNIALVEKVKDGVARMWYAQQTIENGWTRDVLVHQIELKLFERSEKAINNFSGALPAPQSELAAATFKDPYVFDFVTLSRQAKEHDLQEALVANVRKTLLELGIGFAFVGSNYHLLVDDKDYYIDLLFYHVRLRCYVVVELKIGDFKPQHAGQVNFYSTVIDEQVKQPDDNPTIGIILVKDKAKVTAEYALRRASGPIGVASYQYTTDIPEDLQDQLPDITQLESTLERTGSNDDTTPLVV